MEVVGRGRQPWPPPTVTTHTTSHPISRDTKHTHTFHQQHAANTPWTRHYCISTCTLRTTAAYHTSTSHCGCRKRGKTHWDEGLLPKGDDLDNPRWLPHRPHGSGAVHLGSGAAAAICRRCRRHSTLHRTAITTWFPLHQHHPQLYARTPPPHHTRQQLCSTPDSCHPPPRPVHNTASNI